MSERIEREKKTIKKMISLYCNKQRPNKKDLCLNVKIY